MPDGFSFSDALIPSAEAAEAKKPAPFSFEDAQIQPQTKGFSFEDAMAPAPEATPPRSARGYRENPPPDEMPGDKFNPAAIRREADVMSPADAEKALASRAEPPPARPWPTTSNLEGATEFGPAATTPGTESKAYQKPVAKFEYAPPGYTADQIASGLVYPPSTDARPESGLTHLQLPRASETTETVVPGQGLVGGVAAAGAQGVASGAGSMVAGTGEAVDAMQRRHGEQLLAAMDRVDSGDVRGADQSLCPDRIIQSGGGGAI